MLDEQAVKLVMNFFFQAEDGIRDASEDEIAKKEKFKLTARMKGYFAVLFILIGILTGMLFLRNDVEARVLRLPGQLYAHKQGDIISNVFTYKLINKTSNNIEYINFKLRKYKGEIKLVSSEENIIVPQQGMAEGTLFIEIDKKDLKGDKNKLMIEVYSNDKLIETTTVNFLGPRSFN